jgi:hypothetical protein
VSDHPPRVRAVMLTLALIAMAIALTACTAQRVERTTDSVRAACKASGDTTAVCKAMVTP